MRARSLLFSALFVLIAFLLPAAAALAQLPDWTKQDPTKEELSMTADPKAPGAAAVYLAYADETNDPAHYHSIYARIKVLSEKGKELATVSLPYVKGSTKITGIHGRTIHADGTVVPLKGKPEDLLSYKSGDMKLKQRVFTLPGVEVGSILEYQYDIHYDDNVYSSPSWEIQGSYFVHKAHYSFLPFEGFQKGGLWGVGAPYLVDGAGRKDDTLMWWEVLPDGVKVAHDSKGRYTLDLTDIPPQPDEEYMPPIESTLYKVIFYYTWAHTGADYWAQESKLWSTNVDRYVEPGQGIRDAVAGIVAPGDGEIDKAKKLYAAVQALDNTDFSREKGKAELKKMGLREVRNAEDVWAQKSGTRTEITLLYLSMLRAAGLHTYDMKVVNRNAGVFQSNYLNFGQLDDSLIVLSTGGQEIPLDPGQKMCPFATVHWIHAGAVGVRQRADGPGIAQTPPLRYTANSVTRQGDLWMDSSGTIQGSFQYILQGQEALFWRQVSLENDEAEVKKRFDQMLQGAMPAGVEAHLDHFLGLGDPDSNLMAVVKAQGTLGTATSKRLLLPGFFFESHARESFVEQAKRQTPVDMLYAERVVDKVTYHLPAGLTVEGAPKDNRIAWPGQADLGTKIEQSPGQILVMRVYARGFSQVKPEQYQDLRGFYREVAANDQQQLVLLIAPERKGN
jgi:hypothetical protein